MENTSIAIVGGGASGLIAALSLAERGLQDRIAVFERLDRVGEKLIATGNGQGNLYNAEDGAEHYRNGAFARAALARYGAESCAAFYRSLGILPVVRQDGRAYPAGLQASAVLDLMRAKLAWHGVRVETGKRVEKLEKRGKGFLLSFGQEKVYAERVLLAAGGRAAPQFGTDGTAYALAEGLGHTVTKTFPSLVQLTTEREPIRGLKGVKAEGIASVVRDGREAKRARGRFCSPITAYRGTPSSLFRARRQRGTRRLSSPFFRISQRKRSKRCWRRSKSSRIFPRRSFCPAFCPNSWDAPSCGARALLPRGSRRLQSIFP